MTIKQKTAYWARWVFFLPLAALITALITAAWMFVNKGDIVDHSYWQAYVYYVAQPIAFVALAASIAPSRHPAVPISASIVAALTYTCYMHTLIHSVLAQNHSWNHPEPATGIPLSSAIALMIIGIAICTWYCAGKLQERYRQSLVIQYFNLILTIVLFIILSISYNFATIIYTDLPDGGKIDILGHYSPPNRDWFRTGRYPGYNWDTADGIMFMVGSGILVGWYSNLSKAKKVLDTKANTKSKAD